MLLRQLGNSPLARYRELVHYAPLFLAAAVAESTRPQDVLISIQEMRSSVTDKYRSLCSELMTGDQRSAILIHKKIESILTSLVEEATPVPRVLGKVARSAVAIVKPIGSVFKAAKGDAKELSDLIESFNEFAEGGRDALGTMEDVDDLGIYRSLQFFNRLHFKRPTSDQFYKDLKRVFGEVSFNELELRAYFGKVIDH